jgi:hypothetical protein
MTPILRTPKVAQVFYDGFRAAVAAGVPKDKAGILVDEQFGAAILRDAVRNATGDHQWTQPADRIRSSLGHRLRRYGMRQSGQRGLARAEEAVRATPQDAVTSPRSVPV